MRQSIRRSVSTAVNGAKLSFGIVMEKLFSNSEQGFFYDPNDLSTMFQDAAGTVPVTGVGQTVGLVLDKSKGLALGNEVVLNGTFNANTNGWTAKNSQLSVINGKMAVYNPTGALDGQAEQRIETLLTPNKLYKLSVTCSKDSTATGWRVLVETNAVSLLNIANTVAKTIEVYFFAPAAGNAVTLRLRCDTLGGTAYFDDVSVKEVKGNHAYQNQAAMRPLLQRNATTGAYYLAFDGSDDFLQTNSIDFTATDKVSLFAGGRKLSDAAAGMITELSTAATTNNGSFFLIAPNNTNSNNIGVLARGTVTQAVTAALVAPANFVSTARINIGGDSLNLRLNGTQVASNVGDQGTGNYGNYPLYIGRRGGTTLPFNGHIYSLIGVGRLTTDAETAAIEKELAKRMGVTLP